MSKHERIWAQMMKTYDERQRAKRKGWVAFCHDRGIDPGTTYLAAPSAR
jgi:hypothetical protein